jgi:hypothetical protein
MASAFEIAACALARERRVGQAVLLEGVGEDLEKAEQSLEVLGVPLECFSEVRRDRQPRHAIGWTWPGQMVDRTSRHPRWRRDTHPRPYPRRNCAVGRPEPISGFDGELGQDGPLEMRKIPAWPGLLIETNAGRLQTPGAPARCSVSRWDCRGPGHEL